MNVGKMVNLDGLRRAWADLYPSSWGRPSAAMKSDAIQTYEHEQSVRREVQSNGAHKHWFDGLHKQRLREASLASRQHERRGRLGFEPTLKIRAYAHDRVVITAYEKPGPGLVVPRMKRRQLSRESGGSSFNKRSETRRVWKIGNRWRSPAPDSGFTTTARNTVRDGGHIIEHYKEGQGVMATVTLAGGGDLVYDVMSAGSGYAVDRLNRWLRYKVVDGLFVYVWELQQRGAPHLHYLFRLPDDIDAGDFLLHLRAEWRKILLDISHESETDLFARERGGSWWDNPNYPECDVRCIDKRYGKYISKYCSKRQSKSGKCYRFRPGRWWGVSYPLRKMIRECRLEIALPVRLLSECFTDLQVLADSLSDAVCGSRWAELPEWMLVKSLSLQFPARCGRAVASGIALMFAGFGGGELAASLNQSRASLEQEEDVSPSSKPELQKLFEVIPLRCSICRDDVCPCRAELAEFKRKYPDGGFNKRTLGESLDDARRTACESKFG